MGNEVRGYYNALMYRVELDGKVIEEAGNSWFDCQSYRTEDEGIGLKEMKRICKFNTKKLAREYHVEYGGCSFEPGN